MSETVTDSTETRRLLRHLRSGEATAFDTLFARYRAYLRQLVDIRMDDRVRRRFDPSDVVQETQLEAARRIGEYLDRHPMPFRVWLRKTAHQRLLKMRREHVDAQKRNVCREVPVPYQSSLHLARRLMGAGITPSEDAAHDEMARHVRRAIGQLPEVDREIVLMLDVEKLSSRQVGYVLDLDPATVRRRHASILLKLHRILRDGGLTGSQL